MRGCSTKQFSTWTAGTLSLLVVEYHAPLFPAYLSVSNFLPSHTFSQGCTQSRQSGVDHYMVIAVTMALMKAPCSLSASTVVPGVVCCQTPSSPFAEIGVMNR